ncbi:MAG TPA: sigma 54-interacting transcriptional regulator [Planctomycetota bacterium]|nr:sigma 54-interacting transcriptional regulator [Planctomycetota bacterium]
MARTNSPDHTAVILDSIADGVFTIDRDGRITSFNRAAERITGFSKEDAVGQFCFDIFRANICQQACALKKTIDTGKEIVNLFVTILTKDNRELPISISTAVLRDGRGRMIGGVETFRDLSIIEELRKELAERYTFHDIVSKNHQVRGLFAILPDIAESDSTVLIQGPSGTGKELFAKAIHHLSRRAAGPFVAVNCGALPDALLESELFGYVKGAFTGADRDKPGRFAGAEAGTLLLDEIGDLSPAMQVKLLRVLQEREYEPLGSTAPRKADVRVIAASNRNLADLVKARAFRSDLFYRINVVRIDLPPLVQRREDIPLLIDHFIRRFNARRGREITGVNDAVMDILMRHDFPGNVRELENIIEHAFVLCKSGPIMPEHLPRELLSDARPRIPAVAEPLASAEAEAIREALHRFGGNKLKTARHLGISRATLWRKLRKHGIREEMRNEE